MRTSFCLAFATLALATSSATAADPASPLETRVFLKQTGDQAAAGINGGFGLSEWNKLIAPDALPPEVRQPGVVAARFWARVGADGRVTACEPREDVGLPQSLARAACAELLKGASISPRYNAPGVAVASERVFTVHASTRTAAEWLEASSRLSPAPSPPPGILFSLDQRVDWPPRVATYPHLQLDALPNVAALDLDEAKGPRGTTAISLGMAPDGTRRCDVTEPSGDAARDVAACRVAASITGRYRTPCDLCFVARVPMLVEWAGKSSRVRLPTVATAYGPSVISSGLRAGAFGATRPAGGRQHATLYVAVDARGKAAGCRTIWSSGDAALDQRLCDTLVARGRYAPGTDIFGRPAAGEATVYARFDELFPDR